ncbi:unknown [Prevotella sp. CAG:592]|nr:unknown [Prevotella sp. CAG:592]
MMHNRTTRLFFLPKSVIRVLASIIRLPTFLMTDFIVVMPRLLSCRYTPSAQQTA